MPNVYRSALQLPAFAEEQWPEYLHETLYRRSNGTCLKSEANSGLLYGTLAVKKLCKAAIKIPEILSLEDGWMTCVSLMLENHCNDTEKIAQETSKGTNRGFHSTGYNANRNV